MDEVGPHLLQEHAARRAPMARSWVLMDDTLPQGLRRHSVHFKLTLVGPLLYKTLF